MSRLQELIDAIPEEPDPSEYAAHWRDSLGGDSPYAVAIDITHDKLVRRDAIIRAYHEALRASLSPNGDSLAALRLMERFEKEFGQ